MDMNVEHSNFLNLVLLCDTDYCLVLVSSRSIESMRAIGLRVVGLIVTDPCGMVAEDIRNGGVQLVRSSAQLAMMPGVDLVVDMSGTETAGKWALALPKGAKWLPFKLARPWMKVFALQFAKMDELQGQIEDLREKASTYQHLFDNSVVGMYRTSIEDGSLIIGNRKLSEIFQYEDYRTFLAEHNALENYVDPKMRDVLFMELEKYGRVDSFEVELKRRDGSTFWACLSGQLFPEKGYNEGMILDIDKRKQAEETNKFLSHRLLNSQEDERKRIARDLHDELGQALSTLQFSMERLKGLVPDGCEQQRRLCEKLVEDIESIGNRVRRISSNLRPDILDHLGLIPALESLVKAFKARTSETQTLFRPSGFKKRLSPEVEIVLYRVVQEALNNIEKHARAGRVEILLTFSYPRVLLTIKDDGVGFVKRAMITKAMKAAGSIGLLGMRERIESIGGEISIRSTLGKGTLIRVKTGTGILQMASRT